MRRIGNLRGVDLRNGLLLGGIAAQAEASVPMQMSARQSICSRKSSEFTLCHAAQSLVDDAANGGSVSNL